MNPLHTNESTTQVQQSTRRFKVHGTIVQALLLAVHIGAFIYIGILLRRQEMLVSNLNYIGA